MLWNNVDRFVRTLHSMLWHLIEIALYSQCQCKRRKRKEKKKLITKSRTPSLFCFVRANSATNTSGHLNWLLRFFLSSLSYICSYLNGGYLGCSNGRKRRKEEKKSRENGARCIESLFIEYDEAHTKVHNVSACFRFKCRILVAFLLLFVFFCRLYQGMCSRIRINQRLSKYFVHGILPCLPWWISRGGNMRARARGAHFFCLFSVWRES